MNSFIQFRKNEDLSFEAFDSELMEMYEAYLKEKGLVKNSTSYYMRIWRSVYNLAVEQGYTTDKKPFKHVYDTLLPLFFSFSGLIKERGYLYTGADNLFISLRYILFLFDGCTFDVLINVH